MDQAGAKAVARIRDLSRDDRFLLLVYLAEQDPRLMTDALDGLSEHFESDSQQAYARQQREGS